MCERSKKYDYRFVKKTSQSKYKRTEIDTFIVDFRFADGIIKSARKEIIIAKTVFTIKPGTAFPGFLIRLVAA